MSDQVQCPNCGGYRVNLRGIDVIDKKSGERISNGWLIIFFGIILLSCLPLALNSREGRSISILMIIVGSAIAMLISGINQQKKFSKVDNIKIYKYTCALCGYEWNRRTDEPIPSVTVRPDLIAKGAQKLEEERMEEERRQRQNY